MKNLRDLLVYSLDNDLSAEEKVRLEDALAKDVELQKERDDLLKMRNLFKGFEVSGNSDFSNTVLEKIKFQNQKSKPQIGAKVFTLFPKVAAASVAILLLVISALYYSEMNFVSDALVGVEDLTLDEAYSFLEY